MNGSRLSSNEYQQLVEQAPVMIWKSNREGACDYFNATWLAFTGRTLQQELGYGWTEGVHPDDLPLCLRTYEQAIRLQGKFEMEYRLRRYDGVHRWIQDCAVPFNNEAGQFAGHIGCCVDVAERVEAQKEQAGPSNSLLPICSGCHKVRDAQDNWRQIEDYLEQHLQIQTTHGLCPDCTKMYFPDLLT